MPVDQIQKAAEWAEYYSGLGWKLTRIAMGTKGPEERGWNRPEAAWSGSREEWIAFGGYPNQGLLHLWSHTMALDIDQLLKARAWFAERGIDIDEVLARPGVLRIESGVADHAKSIWGIPDGIDTRSLKIKDGRHDILEFRCGSEEGMTYQDVLPPSIHPGTGRQYRWADGVDLGRGIPMIPPEILEVWQQGLIEKYPDNKVAGGDREQVQGDVDLGTVQAALAVLDPDCSREEWLSYGMGMHDASGGAEEWYRAWDAWSSGAIEEGKYRGPDDTWKRWRSFKIKPHGVTIGTLFKAAQERGWTLPLQGGMTDEDFLDQVAPYEQAQVAQQAPQQGGEYAETWDQPQEVVNDPLAGWKRAIGELTVQPVDHLGLLGLMRQMVPMLPIQRDELLMLIRDHYRDVVRPAVIDKQMRDIIKEAEAAASNRNLGIDGTALGMSLEQLESRYVLVGNDGVVVDRVTGNSVSKANFDLMHGDLETGIIAAARDNDDEVYAGMQSNASVLRLIQRRDNIIRVDAVDMDPSKPQFYEHGGRRVCNLWDPSRLNRGSQGNPRPWFDHLMHVYGPEEGWHILKCMAYTIRHPERKINHMIIMGGPQGIGKDFLLLPMARCLGEGGYYTYVSVTDLLSDYNGYLMGKLAICINELETDDFLERSKVTGQLKGMTTNPPDTIEINRKYMPVVPMTNLVNIFATTNSYEAIRVNERSRRHFFAWSDHEVMDRHGHMLPGQYEYWKAMWHWMNEEGGADAVIWYLLNEVDLSDFDPGKAPPVTQALLDAAEESRHPVHAILEDMIEDGHPVFEGGAVTATSIRECLKVGKGAEIVSLHGYRKEIDVRTIGKMLRRIHGWKKYRHRCRVGGQRVWVMAFVSDREKMLWEPEIMRKYLQKREHIWTHGEGN